MNSKTIKSKGIQLGYMTACLILTTIFSFRASVTAELISGQLRIDDPRFSGIMSRSDRTWENLQLATNEVGKMEDCKVRCPCQETESLHVSWHLTNDSSLHY